MRLLHCLSQIPGRTGSGVYLQAIIRAAAAAGYRPAVVCGLPAALPLSECNLELPPENLFAVRFETPELPFPVAGMSDVMPYPSTRFASFDTRMLEEYETAFAAVLKRAVARFAPDLIHTHHLWLMSGLVRRLFPRIPVVTSVHGTELRQLELAPRLRQRVVSGVRGIDRVLVLNLEQREKVIAAYGFEPEKVIVTGTGYRQELFCRPVCAKGKIPTLIYAGKLSRAKGVPWLLEAFAELDGELRLWLAGGGGGAEAAEIRIQAAKDSRVELTGMVSQDRLAELFQTAHIMVLPSFFEGLPLVLLEALACGCRVVVTDLPGIRELIGEEAIREGVVSLVPCPPLAGPDRPRPEAEESFRQHLKKALREQLERARQSRNLCCDPLDRRLQESGWNRVFQRIEQVHRRVLESS
jgi:glycosyltransferase involved in cell wall biosynthesis